MEEKQIRQNIQEICLSNPSVYEEILRNPNGQPQSHYFGCKFCSHLSAQNRYYWALNYFICLKCIDYLAQMVREKIGEQRYQEIFLPDDERTQRRRQRQIKQYYRLQKNPHLKHFAVKPNCLIAQELQQDKVDTQQIKLARQLSRERRSEQNGRVIQKLEQLKMRVLSTS